MINPKFNRDAEERAELHLTVVAYFQTFLNREARKEREENL